MRFLTDENIAVSVIRFLRREGFDVVDVKEEKLFGLSDKGILDIARKEGRIVLTHDKDFLGIMRNYKFDIEGIILIRCKRQNPENVIAALSGLLKMPEIKKTRNSLFILSEGELEIVKNEI